MFVLAACSSSPVAIQSIAPSPTLLPTASPVASVNVKAIAAVAYRVAATTYDAILARMKKTCNTLTVPAQVRCWKTLAAGVDAFDSAIRKITMPADTVGDVHAMLKADAAFELVLRQGATAKTVGDVNYWSPQISKANEASSSAANLVRGDLGLPPVPVK